RMTKFQNDFPRWFKVMAERLGPMCAVKAPASRRQLELWGVDESMFLSNFLLARAQGRELRLRDLGPKEVSLDRESGLFRASDQASWHKQIGDRPRPEFPACRYMMYHVMASTCTHRA